MPTIHEIRTAIVTAAQSVAGIGVVHDRERYAQDTKRLAQLYAPGGRTINGWYVRRIATQETSHAIGVTEIIHQWRLRGFHSFTDDSGSELVFDDLIEAMRDRFRADETLGGVVVTTVAGDGATGLSGLQVEEAGTVMFAGVLCHAATLSLFTRHYEG